MKSATAVSPLRGTARPSASRSTSPRTKTKRTPKTAAGPKAPVIATPMTTLGAREKDRGYYRPEKGFDDYLAYLKSFPPLSREEEHTLAVAKENGCAESREKLIKHNLRFSVHKAKKFFASTGGALSLQEFVAIGNEAIIHAVDLFNPHAGVKFTSYADWWVRQRFHLALGQQSRLLPVPQHAQTDTRRLSQAIQTYQAKHWHHPSTQTLAAMTGIAEEDVKHYLPLLAANVSLNKPMGDGASGGADRTTEEGRLSSDPNLHTAAGHDEKMIKQELKELIRKALAELPPDQALTVKMKHEIDYTPGRSFSHIGKNLNQGREKSRLGYEAAEKAILEGPYGERIKMLWEDLHTA